MLGYLPSHYCDGGANFPDKYPWENGVKKWYDHIYVKPAGGNWQRAKESLPVPAGYGVSVSYQNKVIIAGDVPIPII